MDSDKIKRTYYLKPETLSALNTYVTSYCADSTGSTYGAHSGVVDNAINFYTANMIADQSSGVEPLITEHMNMRFRILEDEDKDE